MLDGFKLVPKNSEFKAYEVARMMRELYDEMIRHGFTDEQFFKFIAALNSNKKENENA